MQSSDTQCVIKLYQQKQELMQAFLVLSEQQTQAIEREDYEGLTALIDQKQAIIEKVNSLQPLLPEQTAVNDERLQPIIAQTDEIIARLAVLDEDNLQLIKSHQDGVLAELIKIKKSHQTHAQYRGDNVKIKGAFLDIKQ